MKTVTCLSYCPNKPVAAAMQGADGSFTTDLTQISYSNRGSQPATMFTLIGYDSRGNKTVTVDAKGNSTLQIFDGASRTLESQQLMHQNGFPSITVLPRRFPDRYLFSFLTG